MSDKIDVSAQVTVTDEASGPIESVQRALAGLSAQARHMSEAFRTTLGKGAFGGVHENFAKLRNSFGELHGRVSGIVKPIAGLMGLTGGISFVGVLSGMKEYVSEAIKVGKAAKLLGVGDAPEKLDTLAYAAKRSGIEFDTFVAMVGRGDLELRRAATGQNKGLAALIAKTHFPTKDAMGNPKPMIDMLLDVSKLVMAQKNTGTQRDILQAFFGKGGKEMLPFMLRGVEGIKDLIAQGYALSPIYKQNVKDAIAWKDAVRSSTEQVQDLAQDIYKELVPVFTPLLKQISAVVIALKPDIFEAVKGAIEELSASMAKVKTEDIVQGIKDWWKWGGEIYDMLGGWKAILLIVAAVFVGPWVAALAVATAAMITFTAAVISNPLVALTLLAIAGAAYLIWRYWAPLKAFFISLWAGIRSTFWTVVGWFDQFIGLFTAETLWRLWEPFQNELAGMWTGVKLLFAKAWQGLKWFWDQFVPDAIKDAWDKLPAAFNVIWDGITSAVDAAWKVIKPILAEMRDGMQWVIDHLPELPQPGFMVPGVPNPGQYKSIVPPEFTPGKQGALTGPSPTLASWTGNPWAPMPALDGGAARRDELVVTVNFENAPQWLQKPDIETTDTGRRIRTAVNVGYSMALPA